MWNGVEVWIATLPHHPPPYGREVVVWMRAWGEEWCGDFDLLVTTIVPLTYTSTMSLKAWTSSLNVSFWRSGQVSWFLTLPPT